jgi:hypothetical protein
VRLATKEMYDDFSAMAEAGGHPKSSIPTINVFSQRLRAMGLKRVRSNSFRGFEGVRFKPREKGDARGRSTGAAA